MSPKGTPADGDPDRPRDFEQLLHEAFAPVDPPERVGVRVEDTLRNLTELAADELESWELAAMRDPRNWVRPVVAVAVGGAATTGLAVLRLRARSRRAAGPSAAIEKAAGDLARGMRRSARR